MTIKDKKLKNESEAVSHMNSTVECLSNFKYVLGVMVVEGSKNNPGTLCIICLSRDAFSV